VGYLLKSAARPEFLDAVRRTAGGDAVFTPGLAALVLGEFRRLAAGPAGAEADAPRLTERETEILRMVATGRSYKQIAARLTLSTAPCRTTSRTRWASCTCTTGSSWSGTPSSTASRTRLSPY